ncbi:outer membrane protein assembly factor BamB family protein [Lignipirellula cremea]|uniref:Outer membrane biogenesis protein BamB n=1 Tax=Lignipirellula cremea TaxID=2528010 RepID=A0A518DVP2_9BACT|nr:PQQ-binding-like beta-propeller repeat protein [Lignipirellula cremea]QDU95906.1 outer membrane biogenesis protein BamB [Lignipirellula cremea]
MPNNFPPLCSSLLAAVALCLPYASAAPASAGEWPQILGPQRNAQASNETLAARWPATGPKVLWKAKVGDGFAGPVIQGDTVVVFHRVGNNERLEALSIADGSSQWTTDFPASYQARINPDNGPRCTPLIHGDRVYAFGAAGDLYCVDLKSGRKIWTRGLYADYRGDEGYFGAGSTPIVAGDKLIVNVGGAREQAGLVALSLDTGKTVWKGTDEAASYSSPVLANLHGKTLALFITRMHAMGVDPTTGAVRFSVPFGKLGPTVNAASPVVFGDHVFLSSSYGVGSRVIRIPATGEPQEIWNNEVLASQYSTSIYHDGYLYGSDGREDFHNGQLRCVNALTGEVAWTADEVNVANLILADGKLLIVQVEGEIALAEVTPEAYRPLATARIADGVTRALPALSQGRLFVRLSDRDNSQILCLEVGK